MFAKSVSEEMQRVGPAAWGGGLTGPGRRAPGFPGAVLRAHHLAAHLHTFTPLLGVRMEPGAPGVREGHARELGPMLAPEDSWESGDGKPCIELRTRSCPCAPCWPPGWTSPVSRTGLGFGSAPSLH